MMFRLFCVASLFALTASAAPLPTAAPAPAMGKVAVPHGAARIAIERRIAAIIARHGIVTGGIGVVRRGKLVWQAYFGEERPGLPASRDTRFNVASITKTVTAQVTLRLAARGAISLDEPFSPYWIDADLAGDPRAGELTARLVLMHQTGFPNWRFMQGGKLSFLRDPGTGYGYSGEGFEYLGHFLEKKLGKPYPQIVRDELFRPLGIKTASVAVNRAETSHMARTAPVDGKQLAPYCRPQGGCRAEGSWSAADDMTITLPDYARILGAVAGGRGYGRDMVRERDRVRSVRGAEATVDCGWAPGAPCPERQGYGLGFELVDYGAVATIGHGGSDWSELAIAYAWRPSGDGVVIFLNGLNEAAILAMPEILELIDPQSPYLNSYRRWVELRRKRAGG